MFAKDAFFFNDNAPHGNRLHAKYDFTLLSQIEKSEADNDETLYKAIVRSVFYHSAAASPKHIVLLIAHSFTLPFSVPQ